MSEEIKQAATVTADAGATPPVEGAGAPDTKPDDLDALLEQYRKETAAGSQPETTQTKPPAAPAVPADVVPRSEFEALKAQITQEQTAKELDALAKGVRAAGDLPEILSDDDIIGILDRRAAKDPALTKAWIESRNDPKARAKLVQKLGESLGKQFAKARGVDENATADREAVAASVRGSSTKAPEGRAPDYGRMSDNEFRKEAEKFGITF